MTDYLTYYNINWNIHIQLFDKYSYIQTIFLINPDEINNCLKIGKSNNYDIYDLTYSKIKKLNTLGPFIVLKKFTNGNQNIEESMINYFNNNKYLKWIGIVDNNISKEYYIKNEISKLIFDSNSICYLIPHRNRLDNLIVTIDKIFEYNKKNNINADIWITELNKFGNWNKGVTINCGFKILENFYDYFIFNDADTFLNYDYKLTLPKDNEINHLFGYNYCLGGIFICKANTFRKINGFSNNFFNWGREDRDIEDRAKLNDIKINRDFLVNLLSSDKITQLKHSNDFNYWNNKNQDNYSKSRSLYYLNQIEHFFKNYDNGLKSLVNNKEIDSNRKVILFINLKEWTDGNIKLHCKDKEHLKIDIFPERDTGLMLIKAKYDNFELPINPDEKYPKIYIELLNLEKYTKVTLKYNFIFEKNFIIEKVNYNDIELKYSNISLEFDNIYTPFKDEGINFDFNTEFRNKYNLINLNV